jgi:hypothetical protein
MKKIFPIALFGLFALNASAQHEHHKMNKQKDTVPVKKAPDSMHNQHHDHAAMQQGGPVMSHAFSRNLSMNRNGSGTAWLPDEAPMYGYMLHSKKWMYMIHGNLFLRYNNQDIARSGSRGAHKFDAPNWVMGMGQTAIGKKGLLRFSAMISFDRPIMGGDGYPLLFQSGETWKGKPLVDRQHPHDLFAELSVGYTYALNKDLDIFGYIGYPGEPALGGTAFMHRPSSLYNPDAPLGHHWQDATHITFGVATVGIRYKNFKLEGSSFTGREPDEDRYNFDKARFDSWSARLTYNPTKELSLQVSQGFVKSPEPLHPGEDVRRTTASVIHAKRFGKDAMLNSALVWGYNRVDQDHKEHSFLAESAFSWKKNAIYGKYEFVEKSTDELALDEDVYGHHGKFPVSALTLGLNRKIFTLGKTDFSIGTQATLYMPEKALESLYGSNPWAYQVFIRVNPGLMR